MKIEGVRFEVPKNLAKIIKPNAEINGWGTIERNINNSTKKGANNGSEYFVRKNEFPEYPNPNPWLILSEEEIQKKGLKEGDSVGIVSYLSRGRKVLDLFKEIPS
jgi:hypothetical protein